MRIFNVPTLSLQPFLAALLVLAGRLLVLAAQRMQAFLDLRQRDLGLRACLLLLLARLLEAAQLGVGLVDARVQLLHLRLGLRRLRARLLPRLVKRGDLLLDALHLIAADGDFFMQPLPTIAVSLHAATQVG